MSISSFFQRLQSILFIAQLTLASLVLPNAEPNNNQDTESVILYSVEEERNEDESEPEPDPAP